MSVASIAAELSVTIAPSACGSGFALAATFSTGRTGDESDAALSISGAEIASASRACPGMAGFAGGAAGRGSVSHIKPTPKKIPTVAAPTTPMETRWSVDRTSSFVTPFIIEQPPVVRS